MNTEMLLVIMSLVILALLVYLLLKNRERFLQESESKVDSEKIDKTLSELNISIEKFKESMGGTTQDLSNKVLEMYSLLTKGGAKTQGQFGEVVLSRVLEHAGLKKGTHYLEQKRLGSEIPDFILMLPDNRKVVVDSKVSLADYSKFLNADTSSLKDEFKKNHIMAVKRHIKSLASTEYRALFGNDSLDLIIMFMPVEGAYISACEEDVIKEALRSKIAIVGPTTLIAIIQIIIRTWNNKKQSEATDEIVRLATGVYDQARLVSESFIDFEEFYNKSKDKINEGRKRTENLVNKVENMRTIGGLEPKKGISEKLRSINKDN